MEEFEEPTPENIHEYLKKFGLKIRYKPHSLLKEYNACFMVNILGRKIDTNAGKNLVYLRMRYGYPKSSGNLKNTFFFMRLLKSTIVLLEMTGKKHMSYQ